MARRNKTAQSKSQLDKGAGMYMYNFESGDEGDDTDYGALDLRVEHPGHNGGDRDDLSLTSQDGREFMAKVKDTCFDPAFDDRFWRVESIQLIGNTTLENRYDDKRTAQLEKMVGQEDGLQEVLVFSAEPPKFCREIAKDGYRVGLKKKHLLGHSGSGVHLVRHYDILTRYMTYQFFTGTQTIMVSKAFLGKAKAMEPTIARNDDDYNSPDSEYDCHFSARRPLASMPIVEALHCSYVYFYEFEPVSSNPVKYPRQILPYAMITLKKKPRVSQMAPFLAVSTGESNQDLEVFGETRHGFRFKYNPTSSRKERIERLKSVKCKLKTRLQEFKKQRNKKPVVARDDTSPSPEMIGDHYSKEHISTIVSVNGADVSSNEMRAQSKDDVCDINTCTPTNKDLERTDILKKVEKSESIDIVFNGDIYCVSTPTSERTKSLREAQTASYREVCTTQEFSADEGGSIAPVRNKHSSAKSRIATRRQKFQKRTRRYLPMSYRPYVLLNRVNTPMLKHPYVSDTADGNTTKKSFYMKSKHTLGDTPLHKNNNNTVVTESHSFKNILISDSISREVREHDQRSRVKQTDAYEASQMGNETTLPQKSDTHPTTTVEENFETKSAGHSGSHKISTQTNVVRDIPQFENNSSDHCCTNKQNATQGSSKPRISNIIATQSSAKHGAPQSENTFVDHPGTNRENTCKELSKPDKEISTSCIRRHGVRHSKNISREVDDTNEQYSVTRGHSVVSGTCETSTRGIVRYRDRHRDKTSVAHSVTNKASKRLSKHYISNETAIHSEIHNYETTLVGQANKQNIVPQEPSNISKSCETSTRSTFLDTTFCTLGDTPVHKNNNNTVVTESNSFKNILISDSISGEVMPITLGQVREHDRRSRVKRTDAYMASQMGNETTLPQKYDTHPTTTVGENFETKSAGHSGSHKISTKTNVVRDIPQFENNSSDHSCTNKQNATQGSSKPRISNIIATQSSAKHGAPQSENTFVDHPGINRENTCKELTKPDKEISTSCIRRHGVHQSKTTSGEVVDTNEQYSVTRGHSDVSGTCETSTPGIVRYRGHHHDKTSVNHSAKNKASKRLSKPCIANETDIHSDIHKCETTLVGQANKQSIVAQEPSNISKSCETSTRSTFRYTEQQLEEPHSFKNILISDSISREVMPLTLGQVKEHDQISRVKQTDVYEASQMGNETTLPQKYDTHPTTTVEENFETKSAGQSGSHKISAQTNVVPDIPQFENNSSDHSCTNTQNAIQGSSKPRISNIIATQSSAKHGAPQSENTFVDHPGTNRENTTKELSKPDKEISTSCIRIHVVHQSKNTFGEVDDTNEQDSVTRGHSDVSGTCETSSPGIVRYRDHHHDKTSVDHSATNKASKRLPNPCIENETAIHNEIHKYETTLVGQANKQNIVPQEPSNISRSCDTSTRSTFRYTEQQLEDSSVDYMANKDQVVSTVSPKLSLSNAMVTPYRDSVSPFANSSSKTDQIHCIETMTSLKSSRNVQALLDVDNIKFTQYEPQWRDKTMTDIDVFQESINSGFAHLTTSDDGTLIQHPINMNRTSVQIQPVSPYTCSQTTMTHSCYVTTSMSGSDSCKCAIGTSSSPVISEHTSAAHTAELTFTSDSDSTIVATMPDTSMYDGNDAKTDKQLTSTDTVELEVKPCPVSINRTGDRLASDVNTGYVCANGRDCIDVVKTLASDCVNVTSNINEVRRKTDDISVMVASYQRPEKCEPELKSWHDDPQFIQRVMRLKERLCSNIDVHFQSQALDFSKSKRTTNPNYPKPIDSDPKFIAKDNRNIRINPDEIANEPLNLTHDTLHGTESMTSNQNLHTQPCQPQPLSCVTEIKDIPNKAGINLLKESSDTVEKCEQSNTYLSSERSHRRNSTGANDGTQAGKGVQCASSISTAVPMTINNCEWSNTHGWEQHSNPSADAYTINGTHQIGADKAYKRSPTSISPYTQLGITSPYVTQHSPLISLLQYRFPSPTQSPMHSPTPVSCYTMPSMSNVPNSCITTTPTKYAGMVPTTSTHMSSSIATLTHSVASVSESASGFNESNGAIELSDKDMNVSRYEEEIGGRNKAKVDADTARRLQAFLQKSLSTVKKQQLLDDRKSNAIAAEASTIHTDAVINVTISSAHNSYSNLPTVVTDISSSLDEPTTECFAGNTCSHKCTKSPECPPIRHYLSPELAVQEEDTFLETPEPIHETKELKLNLDTQTLESVNALQSPIRTDEHIQTNTEESCKSTTMPTSDNIRETAEEEMPVLYDETALVATSASPLQYSHEPPDLHDDDSQETVIGGINLYTPQKYNDSHLNSLSSAVDAESLDIINSVKLHKRRCTHRNRKDKPPISISSSRQKTISMRKFIKTATSKKSIMNRKNCTYQRPTKYKAPSFQQRKTKVTRKCKNNLVSTDTYFENPDFTALEEFSAIANMVANSISYNEQVGKMSTSQETETLHTTWESIHGQYIGQQTDVLEDYNASDISVGRYVSIHTSHKTENLDQSLNETNHCVTDLIMHSDDNIEKTHGANASNDCKPTLNDVKEIEIKQEANVSNNNMCFAVIKRQDPVGTDEFGVESVYMDTQMPCEHIDATSNTQIITHGHNCELVSNETIVNDDNSAIVPLLDTRTLSVDTSIAETFSHKVMESLNQIDQTVRLSELPGNILNVGNDTPPICEIHDGTWNGGYINTVNTKMEYCDNTETVLEDEHFSSVMESTELNINLHNGGYSKNETTFNEHISGSDTTHNSYVSSADNTDINTCNELHQTHSDVNMFCESSINKVPGVSKQHSEYSLEAEHTNQISEVSAQEADYLQDNIQIKIDEEIPLNVISGTVTRESVVHVSEHVDQYNRAENNSVALKEEHPNNTEEMNTSIESKCTSDEGESVLPTENPIYMNADIHVPVNVINIVDANMNNTDVENELNEINNGKNHFESHVKSDNQNEITCAVDCMPTSSNTSSTNETPSNTNCVAIQNIEPANNATNTKSEEKCIKEQREHQSHNEHRCSPIPRLPDTEILENHPDVNSQTHSNVNTINTMAVTLKSANTQEMSIDDAKTDDTTEDTSNSNSSKRRISLKEIKQSLVLSQYMKEAIPATSCERSQANYSKSGYATEKPHTDLDLPESFDNSNSFRDDQTMCMNVTIVQQSANHCKTTRRNGIPSEYSKKQNHDISPKRYVASYFGGVSGQRQAFGNARNQVDKGQGTIHELDKRITVPGEQHTSHAKNEINSPMNSHSIDEISQNHLAARTTEENSTTRHTIDKISQKHSADKATDRKFENEIKRSTNRHTIDTILQKPLASKTTDLKFEHEIKSSTNRHTSDKISQRHFASKTTERKLEHNSKSKSPLKDVCREHKSPHIKTFDEIVAKNKAKVERFRRIREIKRATGQFRQSPTRHQCSDNLQSRISDRRSHCNISQVTNTNIDRKRRGYADINDNKCSKFRLKEEMRAEANVHRRREQAGQGYSYGNSKLYTEGTSSTDRAHSLNKLYNHTTSPRDVFSMQQNDELNKLTKGCVPRSRESSVNSEFDASKYRVGDDYQSQVISTRTDRNANLMVQPRKKKRNIGYFQWRRKYCRRGHLALRKGNNMNSQIQRDNNIGRTSETLTFETNIDNQMNDRRIANDVFELQGLVQEEQDNTKPKNTLSLLSELERLTRNPNPGPRQRIVKQKYKQKLKLAMRSRHRKRERARILLECLELRREESQFIDLKLRAKRRADTIGDMFAVHMLQQFRQACNFAPASATTHELKPVLHNDVGSYITSTGHNVSNENAANVTLHETQCTRRSHSNDKGSETYHSCVEKDRSSRTPSKRRSLSPTHTEIKRRQWSPKRRQVSPRIKDDRENNDHSYLESRTSRSGSRNKRHLNASPCSEPNITEFCQRPQYGQCRRDNLHTNKDWDNYGRKYESYSSYDQSNRSYRDMRHDKSPRCGSNTDNANPSTGTRCNSTRQSGNKKDSETISNHFNTINERSISSESHHKSDTSDNNSHSTHKRHSAFDNTNKHNNIPKQSERNESNVGDRKRNSNDSNIVLDKNATSRKEPKRYSSDRSRKGNNRQSNITACENEHKQTKANALSNKEAIKKKRNVYHNECEFKPKYMSCDSTVDEQYAYPTNIGKDGRKYPDNGIHYYTGYRYDSNISNEHSHGIKNIPEHHTEQRLSECMFSEPNETHTDGRSLANYHRPGSFTATHMPASYTRTNYRQGRYSSDAANAIPVHNPSWFHNCEANAAQRPSATRNNTYSGKRLEQQRNTQTRQEEINKIQVVASTVNRARSSADVTTTGGCKLSKSAIDTTNYTGSRYINDELDRDRSQRRDTIRGEPIPIVTRFSVKKEDLSETSINNPPGSHYPYPSVNPR